MPGTLTVLTAGPKVETVTGASGRPASFFTFAAEGFTPGTLVTVEVEGRIVLRLPADNEEQDAGAISQEQCAAPIPAIR